MKHLLAVLVLVLAIAGCKRPDTSDPSQGTAEAYRIPGDPTKLREPQQAVMVYLDLDALPPEIADEYDLATLEEQLIAVIQEEKLGEFDGNEMGGDEVVLYMYGPDAERLYAGVRSTLRRYPLCRNARVVVRRGGPGAQQREERLPSAQ